MYIVRIWTLSYILKQRSPNRFGSPELTSHAMSYGVIYSIRNENIQCLRSSIVRERIAKNVYVTRCTCERCGHIWEVPDGQKIQSSCPSRSCRSIFWDRPITRQGVSEFAKAARPKDWAARRARGWKHPASKSWPSLTDADRGQTWFIGGPLNRRRGTGRTRAILYHTHIRLRSPRARVATATQKTWL